MKKYNLKRFLASLLAVLMLASVTGVSPAVFAEETAAPELVETSIEQPKEVLIKSNFTNEQVLTALANALLKNSDAVDAQSLDWTYTCAVKGKYKTSKYDLLTYDTKEAREANVPVFGKTYTDPKYVYGNLFGKDLTAEATYTYPALKDNADGAYTLYLNGQAVYIKKVAKLSSSVDFTATDISVPFNNDGTIDYAQLKERIMEKVVTNPADIDRSSIVLTYEASPDLSKLGENKFIDKITEMVGKEWMPIDGGSKKVIGIDVPYFAMNVGENKIKLSWAGDDQYKPFEWTGDIKLVDNRIQAKIVFKEDASITYNMDANVMIEDIIKNAIDWEKSELPADYKASDFTVKYYNADEDKWLPIGGLEKNIKAGILKDYPHINAGDGQQIQVTFNGSKDYKPSDTAEGTLNVAKADVKVSMKLLTSVLAGQKVNKDVLKVTLDPDDPELDLYIVFVGFNTYKEKTIYVKLTEDQEKVIDFISDTQKSLPPYYKEEETLRGKLNEGMTVDEFITYVDELMKNDAIKSALEKNGIDAEMLQNIVTALKSINKVTGDLRIAIGSPKHAGLYQAFAVAVNKNYNTGVGTGTVIVAMNAAGMKLEPNTELKKQTITVSEAEKYKKGEKAVATLTCDGDASDIDQSCIHYRFTGLNKIYSSHDFPTAPGKYIVTVSVRGGDYYALPTTFTFTVKAD